MKKKFIAVSMVLGALALSSTTLTSCVDDNESASVTAIRDAKAAQLDALAAEANAQAKVNEAIANLRQAEADAQNAQTEFDKKEYEARLEKLQAQYQQAIAEAQKAQALAEQGMQTGLMEHQKTLYGNYKAAQKEVTSLSDKIATKSVEVSKLEAGLITAQKYAAEKVIEYRIDSLQAEAEKAAYVAMGENNYEDLIKEAEALSVQRETQNTEVAAKRNELEAAQDAFNKAKLAFEGGSQIVEGDIVKIDPTLETGKAIKTIEDLGYGSVLTYEPQYVDPEDLTSPSINVYSINQANLLRANATLDQWIIYEKNNLGTDKDKAANIWYDFGDGEGKKLAIWTDANKDNIQDPNEITIAGTQWSKYLYYVNKYNDLKKAWEDAKDEDKDQAKIYMDHAEANMLEQKEDLITQTEEYIANYQETKESLKKATDAFTGDTYKAYTDAITAVLAKEGKALDSAQDAINTALLALAEIDGKIKANDYLVGANGTVIDINKKIAECDTAIAEATQDIKEAEMLVNNPEGGIYGNNATAQTLLDNAKAELEDLNEQLKVAQAAAESWKEQLEASLKGETTDTPATETPAE